MKPSDLLMLACFLMTFVQFASADRWEFFYPESVVDYGCTEALVSQQLHGSDAYFDKWVAIANAHRSDPKLGDWNAVIGEFPATKKGRHQAEKVCSKWMDEATKRIRKARGK